MSDIQDVRRRHITLMHHSGLAVGHVIGTITDEEASLWRDGGEGWTVVEVVGHLLDAETMFHSRAVMLLEQENPQLPFFYHEERVREQDYKAQSVRDVYGRFMAARRDFMAFFEGLDESGWDNAGIHPERGAYSMTDAVIQAGHHAVNHLEQITRIILEKRTS